MPIKVSFPFGDRHPVLAAVGLTVFETIMVWYLWRGATLGYLSTRFTRYSNHTGIGMFEIIFAVQALGALAIALLIVKLVCKAFAERKRDAS